MSVEVAGLALWKIVTGALVGAFMSILGYTWKKQDTRIKDTVDRQAVLEADLLRNYYDKVQTQEYVGLVLEPYRQALESNTEATKELSKEIRLLREDR